ncbi:MAG: PadR family transcriptional regulator [Lachnospiraceae bacterium]|nr:PadR family transcriptional regulator [Lachnospiraceae bacterium]
MTYQLTAPLLDACVLGIVNNEDSYGYTLTQKMRQIVDISESTLYPVLRRLQKSGHLRTYDEPFGGRNRRYYAITDEGKELLNYYAAEWKIYKEKIDELVAPVKDAQTQTDGGSGDEQD